MLAAYPLLSCHIHEAQSRKPKCARPKAEHGVQVQDVLTPMARSDQSHCESIEDILAQETHPLPCSFDDLSKAPLWKVQVRRDTTSSDNSNSRYSSLVILTIHHAISDGRGTANLLQHILGDGEITSSGSDGIIPPASDSFLPLKPSLAYMLPIVFQELIIPRLPAFLRPYLLATPSWPTTQPIQAKPLLAPKGIKRIVLPGSLPTLKKRGAEQGVKTINTIVHTAVAVASYIVAREFDASQTSVQLDTATAISERTAPESISSQIPDVSGNYVSSLKWTSTVSPQDDFWHLALQYAHDITSSQTRAHARYTIGLLAYLPDAEYVDVVNADRNTGPQAPVTTWESYIHTKALSDRPFRSSFEISNLGRMTFPPSANVTDMAWCQRPSAGSCAFVVDVCGLGDDLSLCIGWHKDSIGVEQENRFAEVVQKVLRLMAEDQQEEARTVEDIRRLCGP